ncbi:MAG: RnfABCDGE type electron transport complex subunit G [Planctomycetota bacterium]
MSQKRGEYVRYALVLLAVSACAALLVAGVYTATSDVIRRNEAMVKQSALHRVFPDAQEFDFRTFADPHDADRTVVVTRADGKPVGYATVGKAAGYGGTIRVLVGLGPDIQAPTVKLIEVLSHSETPGLGAKIQEVASTETLWSWIGKKLTGKSKGEAQPLAPWFQAQFAGRNAAQVRAFARNPKEGGEIDAITAATVSSRAVATAVLDGVTHVTETVAAPTK